MATPLPLIPAPRPDGMQLSILDLRSFHARIGSHRRSAALLAELSNRLTHLRICRRSFILLIGNRHRLRRATAHDEEAD